MIKNMKIKKRLILGFLIVLVVSSFSGVISVFVTSNMNKEYSDAMKNYGFAQGDVGKVLSCFGSINVSVHDSINYLDPTEQQKVQDTYKAQLAKMDTYFNNAEVTIQQQDTKEMFKKAKDAWNQYLPLAEELMKEGDTDDSEVVKQVQARIANELQPLYNTVYDSLAEVMASKVDNGNALEARLTRSVNRSTLTVIVLLVVAVIVSVSTGSSIANGIANPLHACAKRLHDLMEGDLTSPVPQVNSKNEIGMLADSTKEIVEGLNAIIGDEKYLLGAMADGNFDVRSKALNSYVGDFSAVLEAVRMINYRLSDTLSKINESSEEVSSGSNQVSLASQNLAQGASEQASSIEELSATIDEISDQVARNAENAGIASEKALAVGDEMETSNQKMQQMMNAMTEISSSSNEIGKIIKTIEDIAFQTNILALNAAVEAARAGEAGKGFAVVADEVRNLASKSADASKNTAQLIETSIRAVENGTKIAGETAQSLLTAVEGAKEVVEVIEKISTASSAQSDSITQVTQSMDQISNVVQTNSATAEESAASSEELSRQAQILKELVEHFRLRAKEDMAGSIYLK